MGVSTFIMWLYLPISLSTMMDVFDTVKPDKGEVVEVLAEGNRASLVNPVLPISLSSSTNSCFCSSDRSSSLSLS